MRVKFETAKLAKEKGFDNPCGHFYIKKNSKVFGIDEHGRYYKIKSDFKKLYNSLTNAVLNAKNIILAPTQSELQKWLWDKYKIWVFVNCDSGGNFFHRIKKDFKLIRKHWKNSYSCPYETLEQGLYETLKLIKL